MNHVWKTSKFCNFWYEWVSPQCKIYCVMCCCRYDKSCHVGDVLVTCMSCWWLHSNIFVIEMSQWYVFYVPLLICAELDTYILSIPCKKVVLSKVAYTHSFSKKNMFLGPYIIKSRIYSVTEHKAYSSSLLHDVHGYSFCANLGISIQYPTFKLDWECQAPRLGTIQTFFQTWMHLPPEGNSLHPQTSKQMIETMFHCLQDCQVYINIIDSSLSPCGINI